MQRSNLYRRKSILWLQRVRAVAVEMEILEVSPRGATPRVVTLRVDIHQVVAHLVVLSAAVAVDLVVVHLDPTVAHPLVVDPSVAVPHSVVPRVAKLTKPYISVTVHSQSSLFRVNRSFWHSVPSLLIIIGFMIHIKPNELFIYLFIYSIYCEFILFST